MLIDPVAVWELRLYQYLGIISSVKTLLIPLLFYSHSSFLGKHKVGNVDIFVLLEFENELDTVTSHNNYNSMHHDKFTFA